MFKSLITKLTGAKQQPATDRPIGEPDPATAVFLRVMEEKRKAEPLIGAKLGGKEVFQRLLSGMKNEKGVHIESLLCALGALAGYSCQASLRAEASTKGLPETALLITVDTTGGKKYFVGDALNSALAESKYSVWGLAAGAAKANGCKDFPDIRPIFAHVATTVGSELFGIPRLPPGHNTADIPINYLKLLWPALLPVAKMFCPRHAEWPVLFGIAIQEAIDMGKSVLAPDIALLIVMESAVPMSKVDLATA